MSIPVIMLLPSSLAMAAVSMSAEGETSGGILPEGFTLDSEFQPIVIGDETTQASMASAVGAATFEEPRVAVRALSKQRSTMFLKH